MAIILNLGKPKNQKPLNLDRQYLHLIKKNKIFSSFSQHFGFNLRSPTITIFSCGFSRVSGEHPAGGGVQAEPGEQGDHRQPSQDARGAGGSAAEARLLHPAAVQHGLAY